MSTNELTSKIRELKELKAMAEEIAAEITTIEDTIKSYSYLKYLSLAFITCFIAHIIPNICSLVKIKFI